MSPAGMSVLAPMCFDSSLMKDTQNLRISLSDLPLGSKSAPPLPPPMFTCILRQRYLSRVLSRYSLTACKSILENLLEPKELQDGEVDRGMETEASFVWSQSRVELHPVTPIDLHFSFVVLPDHTELYHAFRNGGNLQSFLVFRIFLEEGGIFES